MREAWGEVPPTAGLPPSFSDLWPLGTRHALRPPGIDDAILLCSGTAALVVALQTLAQASTRKEVVIPAYTCPLVALAVAHCGLRVRLCDVGERDLDFDPAELRAACGTETLAVVVTHLGGRVADVGRARVEAQRVGAVVIEDAAQAWGGLYANQPLGLHGDIGFFSLAVGKGLSLFEGGVLVARDPALREALRKQGAVTAPRRWLWEIRRSLQLLGYYACYRPLPLQWAYGRPYRRALRRGDWVGAVGDKFSADIPLHSVGAWRQRVGERAARRWSTYASAIREQALRRLPLLRALPGVHVFGDAPGDVGAWPFLWLRMPTEAACISALQALAFEGVGVTRLYVHALPSYDYLSDIFDGSALVPNARRLAATSLTISNSLWCDDTTFEHILAVLACVLSD